MKLGKCNWGNETGQVKGWKKLGQLKFLLKIIGPTIKSRAKKAWANKVLVFIQVNATLKYTTSEKNSINLGLFQKDPMADSDSKISRSHNIQQTIGVLNLGRTWAPSKNFHLH